MDAAENHSVVEVPDNEPCEPAADWPSQFVRQEEQLHEAIDAARHRGASCGEAGAFPRADPLRMTATLRCAARLHVLDMIERGFVDHENPDGLTVADRAEIAGYVGSVNELLAAGSSSPAHVLELWSLEGELCALLHRSDLSDVGVAFRAARDDSPHASYWTVVIGSPAP